MMKKILNIFSQSENFDNSQRMNHLRLREMKEDME